MSKNNLSDLNNHLFNQLERLANTELDQDGLEQEVKRSDSIIGISEKIIDNAQIAFKAAELVAKHGIGNWENMLPAVENKPSSPGVADYSKQKVIK